MGQVCTAQEGPCGGVDRVKAQADAFVFNAPLERALDHAVESGEFVITEKIAPNGFDQEDVDLMNKSFSRLRDVKLFCLGDVANQTGILDALAHAKESGNLPSLKEVYLVGRTVNDKIAECAAKLCESDDASTSNVDTVVVAHGRKNKLGDAGIQAFARRTPSSA